MDVVDDGLFDEGQFQVVAFAVDLGRESEEFIELDGVVADVDCMGRGVP